MSAAGAAGDPAALVAGLRDRVLALAAARPRVLVGVVGEPGAGKSTLTAALAEALVASGVSTVVVPMDGFHLANVELARLGRADRKGAIDTFDGAGYLALLRRLRDPAEGVVYAPMYVRGQVESSIGSAIPVAPDVRVVLTEGNYLLVEAEPWRQVRAVLDETWFVDVDPELRRRRLFERHVANGKSTERASAFTFGSDEVNARLVSQTRELADLVVPWA
jgi:pantothenate kinase